MSPSSVFWKYSLSATALAALGVWFRHVTMTKEKPTRLNGGTTLEALMENDEKVAMIYGAKPRDMTAYTRFLSSLPTTVKVIPLLILYGTEYGCSMELAYRLYDTIVQTEMQRPQEGPYYAPMVQDMSQYESVMDVNHEQLVLFVTSTYGDGVPPTTARTFLDNTQLLTSPSVTFKFSVLALGDSNYPHFCRVGKRLDAKLSSLGARSIAARVNVDQEDDEAIEKWFSSIAHALEKHRTTFQCTLHTTVPKQTHTLPDAINNENTPVMNHHDGFIPTVTMKKPSIPWSRTHPYLSRCVAKRRLTRIPREILENREIPFPEMTLDELVHEKHTFHIQFAIDRHTVSYECGDSIGIHPMNDTQLVDAILSRLQYSPEERVYVPDGYRFRAVTSKEETSESDAMATLSLRDALLYCYDVNNMKPDVLRMMQFCMNETDSLRIHRLFQEGDVKMYLSTRDLYDLLLEYNVTCIQLNALLNALKPLLPRAYSVSSSPHVEKHALSLTVAAVYYLRKSEGVDLSQKWKDIKDPLLIRKGVCSAAFLNDVVNEESVDSQEKNFLQVPLFVNRNPDFKMSMHMIGGSPQPMILIGPGTGLAPYRGFLQERALFVRADADPLLSTTTDVSSSLVVYFGCRHRDLDFLYRDELKMYEKQRVITLHTAFSREKEAAEKVYVQDMLRRNKEEVWRLLNDRQGSVYVCGDAKYMAVDVHQTLLDICEEKLQDVDKAKQYLAQLESTRRYQKDVWF